MLDTIYLDYAATTPVDERVAALMRDVQNNHYANPASNHRAGRESAVVVDRAAQQLGTLLNAAPEAFLWTSGATESNNLAIIGAARQRAYRGRHLITMRTEHKAVVDVFKALQSQGFEVSWLTPEADGSLPLDTLQAAMRDDTQLVSIMHVNNETGVVQDLATLATVCHNRDVLFHVDAAQSVGKVPIDLGLAPIDLLSLTAHKFYGPKGIGALYVGEHARLEPLMFGGGQQRRMRPGTLPVDLIAGLGAAAEIAAVEMSQDLDRFEALKDMLWQEIRVLDGIYVNGQRTGGYPGILNVGADDVEGESLLLALEPLCVATGSACNSQNQEPSYVLRSLGRSDREAQSAIRFSLGRKTTKAEIRLAAQLYRDAVTKLRTMAPERAL